MFVNFHPLNTLKISNTPIDHLGLPIDLGMKGFSFYAVFKKLLVNLTSLSDTIVGMKGFFILCHGVFQNNSWTWHPCRIW